MVNYTHLWYGAVLSLEQATALITDVYFASVPLGQRLDTADDATREDQVFEKQNQLCCDCDDLCPFLSCRLYTPEQRAKAWEYLRPRVARFVEASLTYSVEWAASLLALLDIEICRGEVCCARRGKPPTFVVGVCACEPSYEVGIARLDDLSDALPSWTKENICDSETGKWRTLHVGDARLAVDAFLNKAGHTPAYYVQHCDCSCT